MRFSAVVVALSTLALALTDAAPDQEADSPGWRALFDGRSLDGWEHVGPGRMVLEDGILRTEGGMGLLWYTKERLGDCTIRAVYKTTAKASNSGIYVRIADRPTDEWYAVHHGYEVQICDAADPYHTTGSVYSLSRATARPARPDGQWNTMEITLEGSRIRVILNGEPVNDFDPANDPVPDRKKEYEPERGARPEAGYIGLQNHDDYAEGTHVFFKEVSVRRLGDKP